MFRGAYAQNRIAKTTTTLLQLGISLGRGMILAGIMFVILSPILSIISDAVMNEIDIFNPFVFMIPENFTLENFRAAYRHLNYVSTLTTTLGLSLSAMVLQVLVCSLTGYGFARFEFPCKNILFGVVILSIVVPVQSYMVSLFTQFRFFGAFGWETNLLNTFYPVLIMSALGVGLRSGLFIYIFRQFFKGLPKDLEEAALIDGAGWLRTYIVIMLPNAASAIITVSVFSFVWQYNDTFFAAMFMQQLNLLPVQLTALPGVLLQTAGTVPSSFVSLVVSAAILLAVAPVVTLYFGIQRFFMEGVERSGIVG